MKVLLLTTEQKESLVGQTFAPDSFFNPVQDADDNWFISIEERQFNVNPEFVWINDLPEIDWVPKIYEEV